jgi:hypothetical protein
MDIDIAQSRKLTRRVEEESPSLMQEDWISIPLINSTGKVNDHSMEPRGIAGSPTDYLKQLPWSRTVADFLAAEKLCVEHARLLVLRPLGMFWPHRDAHPFFRLLLPLYSADGRCLYLLEDSSYLAEIGVFYYLQPDAYHAAINLSDEERIVLCFDILSDRKALDFALRRGETPASHQGRLVLSEKMKDAIELMIKSLGEVEPLLAGKLACVIGICLLNGTFESVQSMIRDGLAKCSRDHMTGDKIDELNKLIGIIERHPYYPEIERPTTPGLFDSD